ALATGTEAPATSIAQLGQLDDRGRWRFGRGTLALTIAIVGALTLGLTALAVHLHVGVPRHDSTEIADLAHVAAGGGGLYGLVYAVAVFVSFLAGLLAMARFSHRRGARLLTVTNLLGAVAVAFTLVVNLGRGYPLLAIAGSVLVAAVLHRRWVRAGRPRGIEA